MIDSFYLNKVEENSDRQTEFMSARSIDLSLEWKALFKGKLVGELIFEEPSLRFTENKVELDDISKDTASPAVDVAITQLDGTATNLRNVYDPGDVLPASVDATGNIYEGTMNFSMKLNPLAKDPTFDLNTAVKHANLVLLNG